MAEAEGTNKVGAGNSAVDRHLEDILERVSVLYGVHSGVTPLGYKQLDKMILDPVKSCTIIEYTSATKTTMCNEIYVMAAQYIKNDAHKTRATEEEMKSSIGTLRDPDFEMVSINAQGSTILDQKLTSREVPILGIDIHLKATFEKDLLVDILKTMDNSAFTKVYKVIVNHYQLTSTTRGQSVFITTSEDGSKGYLMTTDIAAHAELPLKDILRYSFSESKAEDLKGLHNGIKTRLYEVMMNGSVKREILGDTPQFKTYADTIQCIANGLFKDDPGFQDMKADAFLNGHEIALSEVLKDGLDALINNGRGYLKRIKPKLHDGIVEYKLGDNLFSEEEDVFLKKVGILYDNDIEMAKKIIFSRTDKNDLLQIYG
ncbi:MAG: hypothetical protein M1348_01040 [Candidatus Parvarchaeota archaeon]|nr:hypothetical protein [Candidatus Parvarchaeota archaeon]MCL5101180.1 hypothetical protein [Candidatus Parvarchaeota archaeon]